MWVDFDVREQQVMVFFIREAALLWIMNWYFGQKQWLKYLMMDLFLINT